MTLKTIIIQILSSYGENLKNQPYRLPLNFHKFLLWIVFFFTFPDTSEATRRPIRLRAHCSSTHRNAQPWRKRSPLFADTFRNVLWCSKCIHEYLKIFKIFQFRDQIYLRILSCLHLVRILGYICTNTHHPCSYTGRFDTNLSSQRIRWYLMLSKYAGHV